MREGIQLTSGFAANVNADLRVGAVAETITVSGASPVVDTRNVVQQQVMTRDVIEAVPSDKNWAHLASYVPGMQGLDTAVTSGSQRQHLQIHGGRSSDEYILINGMSIGFAGTSGPSPLVYPDGSTEEINIATGSHTAEMETGGIRVSIVPKSGGNSFAAACSAATPNDKLQANVLNDDLSRAACSPPTRSNTPRISTRRLAARSCRTGSGSMAPIGTGASCGARPCSTTPIRQDWIYKPDLNRETVPPAEPPAGRAPSI